VNHQVHPSPDQKLLRASDAMVVSGEPIGVIAVRASGGLAGSSGGGCERVCAQMHPSIATGASPVRMGSRNTVDRKPSGDADKETGDLDTQCTLFASMSHEMQQPIYAMQNFMFAARQYLKLGQLDQVEQMLTKIEGQVVRSREISERLRQVAVRSKHIRFYCDVHQLIESCRELVQMHADSARALLPMDLQATKTAVNRPGRGVFQIELPLSE